MSHFILFSNFQFFLRGLECSKGIDKIRERGMRGVGLLCVSVGLSEEVNDKGRGDRRGRHFGRFEYNEWRGELTVDLGGI